MTSRRAVFVVGSGRSGTSTMAGALRTLGLHVPQPEVVGDATNPKGFGEPQWVVDLHQELLQRTGVQVSDARPRAWLEAGGLSADHATRERVTAWLGEQFAHGDELVIKDPRLAWFLGLWRACAERCDARPAYITMLRPVTEVVGSKRAYYDQQQGDVTRTAAWVNMMLHTERATRGETRAFVRYADLLDDWTQPVFALGESFDLAGVKTAMANDIAQVHRFIDPSLRRVRVTWDDLEVPDRLRDLAQSTWELLDTLAGGDGAGVEVGNGADSGDTAAAHALSDELRAAYEQQYAEAEAYAYSSTLAARRAGVSQGRREAAAEQSSDDGGRSTREALDRLPHSVRAMVPAGARRGIRKALGKARVDPAGAAPDDASPREQ